MNYQALKAMVDGLVQTYNCPDCGSDIGEENVEVMGTAGTNINIDIECPKCKKHSMVKAQVYTMNIPLDIAIPNGNTDDIKNMQEKLKEITNLDNLLKGTKKTNKSSIKDEEIVSLNKSLKSNNISMSELFGE